MKDEWQNLSTGQDIPVGYYPRALVGYLQLSNTCGFDVEHISICGQIRIRFFSPFFESGCICFQILLLVYMTDATMWRWVKPAQNGYKKKIRGPKYKLTWSQQHKLAMLSFTFSSIHVQTFSSFFIVQHSVGRLLDSHPSYRFT